MTGYSDSLASNFSKEREKYVYTDPDLFGVLEGIGVKDKDILDFGCGDGIHSIKLAELQAKKIVGIDPSERMIELAQVRLAKSGTSNLSFIIADGNHLPFEDKTFDIVLANYVLIAFSDLTRPLSEIYRVLKPGGSLVATINNAEISDETIKNNPVPLQLGGKKEVIVHDYLRTDKETQKTLQDLNFDITLYKSLDNPDAIVDPSFGDKDKVKNFHCILFSARKK